MLISKELMKFKNIQKIIRGKKSLIIIKLQRQLTSLLLLFAAGKQDDTERYFQGDYQP